MTNESQTEATEAVDEAVESPESLVDRYKALVVAKNDPQPVLLMMVLPMPCTSRFASDCIQL